jgi:hypothetical protein
VCARARLAGLLLDNLLRRRRTAPERLLSIAARTVMSHHDSCRPHLAGLPQELQAMIARLQRQGLPLVPNHSRLCMTDGEALPHLVSFGVSGHTDVRKAGARSHDKSLFKRTEACIRALLLPDEDSDEINTVWCRTFVTLVTTSLSSYDDETCVIRYI